MAEKTMTFDEIRSRIWHKIKPGKYQCNNDRHSKGKSTVIFSLFVYFISQLKCTLTCKIWRASCERNKLPLLKSYNIFFFIFGNVEA
jgi:hypothetical protein